MEETLQHIEEVEKEQVTPTDPNITQHQEKIKLFLSF